VVEVAVGDEDRLDRHAERLDRLDEALGLVARVDQQRVLGALAAGDPGVLLHRPDGEAADVHQDFCLRRCTRL
jgi:hypothetical protein